MGRVIEMLITEVRKRELLWNRTNRDHKDRTLLDKEWRYVAEKVGITKEDAKKKWRNLRDHFAKEFKKIPLNKTGSAPECAKAYSGRWQYFTSLLFLTEGFIPRKPRGKPNAPIQYTKKGSESERLDPSVPTIVDVPDKVFYEKDPLPVQTFRVGSDRVDKSQGSTQKVEVFEKEDENWLFLRSLLPYFRKLDSLQQLRVRSKFQEVLIQEMEHNCLMGPSDSDPFEDLHYSNVSSPVSADFSVHSSNNQPLSPQNNSPKSNSSVDIKNFVIEDIDLS